MRKKRIPEVLVKSVMSLFEGARTRVRLDSELLEEFQVNVWMHQASVLSPSLFAVVVVVVIEFDRECALSELLNASDFVLMCETIEGLRNDFLRWKEAYEGKGLKVNLGKTKVMVRGDITKDDMHECKVDPHWICSLRV